MWGYLIEDVNNLGKWIIEKNIIHNIRIDEKFIEKELERVILLDDEEGTKCVEELVFDSDGGALQKIKEGYEIISG